MANSYFDVYYCSSINAECPVSASLYRYVISLPANAIFLAIFLSSMICYILQGLLTRRAIDFAIAMVLGTFIEVLGYVGRVMSHHNPFQQPGFLMQICCLTIAPAFMSAGIYYCLRSIVVSFGEENSRIKPASFTRIFISCDVGSLILQGVGGGIASSAATANKSPDTGDHIMVAGLSFQVLTLMIFIIICADFVLATLRGRLDPAHSKLRESIKFKGFCISLALATLCIFLRSIYRVAELGEGWTGRLISNQALFIGLEGVLVAFAVVVLNIFHPAYCFKDDMD